MEKFEITELERKLTDGIVEFSYINKSGEKTHRVKGTTTPLNLIFRPRPNENYITFYDMDADKWRRCGKKNIIQVHRFWPWFEDMKVELDPVWVSVVKSAGQEPENVKTESRFVKFFEKAWSYIRDIVKHPEPKTECKIYMPGEPLPYNEAEIEDAECEIL